jgi:hypothetical protein
MRQVFKTYFQIDRAWFLVLTAELEIGFVQSFLQELASGRHAKSIFKIPFER